MLAFFRTFLAVVLAIVFVVAVPIILAAMMMAFGDTGPRDDSWLTFRLTGSLLEHYPPLSLRDVLKPTRPCLMEITENLEKASVDKRIRGVLFRLEDFGAGQGKLDEIRAGIRRIRSAGKPVYAYAQTLTDTGLYLASECDSIFLFPEGHVFLLGRGISLEHLKGTLEKLDIHDQLHVIKEYKSAAELLTRKESSREALENVTWLLEDLLKSYDETVAANLSIEPEKLERLRARAILPAREAVELGLASATLTWEELRDRLKGPYKSMRSVSSEDYAHVDRKSLGLAGKARIAVIHAQGFVSLGGEDRYDMLWGLMMGTDRIIEDIRRARDEDRIKAIILRWDTGGGWTDGAQRIARAVERAREEKPVIVSIADVAASGGYMMSYPASWIVCPANGITGSIGSIMGKLNLRGLYEKLGVTFDDVSLTPNAFLFSELHDYTEDQWDRIAEEHWKTYNEWVENIARARALSFEEVHDAGRGKVWTGRQAKELGLVDALGGFEEALAGARRLAKLDENEKLTLIHYPKKKGLLELILSGEIGIAAAGDFLREIHGNLFGRTPRAPTALSWQPLGSP